MKRRESWGRYPIVNQDVRRVDWRFDAEIPKDCSSVLPYGKGRSYGDCCLNADATIILTEGLNRFISFDSNTGILRAESGVSLEEIIDLVLPRGWFLPVSPGTKFVSLGGAIANDIHGKNHHKAATFGMHVLSFELLRSDGSRLLCSPKENSEMYSATIAGMGLTGLILWAEIQLKKVESAFINLESIQFESLDEFFSLCSESDTDFEYTVAWIDCVTKKNYGRGIFMRGDHASKSDCRGKKDKKSGLGSLLQVPFDFPKIALNPLSIAAFNTVYYNKQFSKINKSVVHYDPFFYPLDAVKHWNRIYGKRGFLQFQCVVPSTDNNRAIREILEICFKARSASFLAVIKEFGDMPSPGMMSFPRKGITLCLDFPFEGEKTMQLFSDLEAVVSTSDGALYSAKDACMSPASYKQYYPRWEEFSSFIDPAFSSSFWRRVMGTHS